jgi:uncharacterized repeat protein (TIGR01451 family)
MNILASFFAALLFLISVPTAFASGTSTCEPIYGGGQNCNEDIKFTINKLVETPKGDKYVENLSTNDAKYKAGSEVKFKIKITNTGKSEIQNINVVDTFPKYLTFLAGVGSTNKGASKVDFVIGKLEAGKSLEYVIMAKAADASALPNAIKCVANKVSATASDGSSASDSSQVCIEKQI